MNTLGNFCEKCLKYDKFYDELSYKFECDHTICVECISKEIQNNNLSKCGICAKNINLNLKQIYDELNLIPIVNLKYNYGFNFENPLWLYFLNTSNKKWLYSKNHNDLINAAYNCYKLNQIHNFEIDINNKLYIIDFKNNKQYPKNFPNKFRTIKMLNLNSSEDITNNNIVGVAGVYL